MHRALFFPSLIVLLTMILSIAPAAQAGTIVFTATGQLELEDGPDTLGLDGASFTFQVTFSDTEVYGDTFGFPFLASLSDSLQISGASVGGVDGTYTEPDGIAFYPEFSGQFYDSNGAAAAYNVNGFTLEILYLSDTTGSAVIGGVVAEADFGLVGAPSNHQFMMLDPFNLWNIVNFEASTQHFPTPIPVPAAALAIPALLGALGIRRRYVAVA
jgi:hypothetical protein